MDTESCKEESQVVSIAKSDKERTERDLRILMCSASVELAQAKNYFSRACTGIEYDESWIAGRRISEEQRKELFRAGCAVLDKWIGKLPDLLEGKTG